MTDAPSCPECGRPLPPNAPGGLCAACLFGGVSAAGSATAAPDRALPELEELNEYFPEFEFRRLLGQGGMGAVYEAFQPGLGRTVAIKILPREAARDPEFTERFRREARTLAALDHPHIVTLHDFGEREGLLHFVMEYVGGTDLAQRIAAHSVTTDEALQYVSQICEALEYSHQQGIVHRDIKPANILLDSSGQVKIADFGLAKLVQTGEPELGLTRSNASIGTPRYMAPEQMEGASTADHRVDIYALGVVFYELLTGEVPAGNFKPPSRRAPGLGDHFDEVVLRSMERDPSSRFRNITEVRTGLQSALALRRTAPGGSRQVARRFFLFRALPAAVGAGGLAAGAVWLALGRRGMQGPPTGAPPSGSGALRALREALPTGSIAGTPAAPSAIAARRDLVACAVGGGSGTAFALALTHAGEVLAWGDNRFGQTEVPPGLRDVVAIAAAPGSKGAHCLALRADGSLAGWGDASYGQYRPSDDLPPLTAIAAGALHSILLGADGSVRVLGHSVDGATEVPHDLPPIAAVASGSNFCLALGQDGSIHAWGSNLNGEGTIPAWVRAAKITAIAAGNRHALALTADGTVYAWGNDEAGQLKVPDELTGIEAVAAGGAFSAVRGNAGWTAWGGEHSALPTQALQPAFGSGGALWLERK